jgi:hypothetical protein
MIVTFYEKEWQVQFTQPWLLCLPIVHDYHFCTIFHNLGPAVQLVVGIACLKALEGQSNPKGTGEARSHLLKATEESGVGGPVSVLGHLLLAELEASGDHKKRGERISRHLSQVYSIPSSFFTLYGLGFYCVMGHRSDVRLS